MKYTITLSGKGYNSAVHLLREEIFNKLEIAYEQDELTNKKVEKIMRIKNTFDLLLMDSVVNKTYVQNFIGLHLNECFMSVNNDSDEYIIQDHQIDSRQLFEEGDYNVIDEEPLQFFVCESVKGIFFEFEISTDSFFDIKKIKPIIQEFPEDIFTIVGLEYDGNILEKENIAEFEGTGHIDFYVSNA